MFQPQLTCKASRVMNCRLRAMKTEIKIKTKTKIKMNPGLCMPTTNS